MFHFKSVTINHSFLCRQSMDFLCTGDNEINEYEKHTSRQNMGVILQALAA